MTETSGVEPTPTGEEPIYTGEAPIPTDVEPTPVLAGPPAVESTRRLLGASFDLLTRTSEDMRRASFYIGIIVLGTVGPLALASWWLQVVSRHLTQRKVNDLVSGDGSGWYVALVFLAVVGLVVAAIESRATATAILGGHQSLRPVTVRQALARSRLIFWRVIVASVIVAIPLAVGQLAMTAFFDAILGSQTDVALLTSTLAAVIVGAPFAYLLTGIVLGDVDPFEATRRSFRVYRARKLAAVLVAVFETFALLLVAFGLSAGLDIALRVSDALGLGPDSDPAGLILVTMGLVAGVFAFGTLVYTALAISLAPQVVMFVGLTQATMGLDHVRPGGDRDPGEAPRDPARFRWITRPMILAFGVGGLGLAAALAALSR